MTPLRTLAATTLAALLVAAQAGRARGDFDFSLTSTVASRIISQDPTYFLFLRGVPPASGTATPTSGAISGNAGGSGQEVVFGDYSVSGIGQVSAGYNFSLNLVDTTSQLSGVVHLTGSLISGSQGAGHLATNIFGPEQSIILGTTQYLITPDTFTQPTLIGAGGTGVLRGFFGAQITATAVPEPGSFGLLIAGGACAGLLLRKESSLRGVYRRDPAR